MIKAKIEVTLKKGVSDPQGLTVQNALKTLQYAGVQDVRIGKYVEIALDARDEKEASEKVKSICEKLLVNPIIEQYRFELERV
ncbi:MAG: phosphoribosylformylglycinamidine synthase subunit PurS [Chlamydiae bacterium]|nr:phosphoribosylformylglycinamidine synthase subunit PurS [Chlamydiota bacterium]MBI3266136.1 phosphoribosylformylglycinamidine synthase subunit PurS [Chlamydiota bacterium]